MRSKFIFALVAAALPVFPAHASFVAVPGPEAGVGLGALVALGIAYAWMRRRSR